jgi:hypothetical protein
MKKSRSIFGLILCFFILSCKTIYNISTSESDAKIFVNGKSIGTGSAEIIVRKHDVAVVKAEKTGYFTQETTLSYIGSKIRNQYITMSKDDAYDASVKNDYANKDFEQEVSNKIKEDEAWKIISQIVTSYFDNIEMADKATGYLKTSWQSRSFTQSTVRSRIIVKQSGTDPLKYKLKIISEIADKPDQSVKDDEKFKEWDRVLKKYDGLITEFQTRLSAK